MWERAKQRIKNFFNTFFEILAALADVISALGDIEGDD